MTYESEAAWLVKRHGLPVQYEVEMPNGPIPVGWVTTNAELTQLKLQLKERSNVTG